ncbi:hypothetical protein JZ751_014179 [Albula glossodonta]|uniref:Outer dense fiber protein 2-like n=1 Tax=Albula glossodonta TaxID=121402 RepID=A0A8T2NVB7_9TELE|nr:hypothetical protein JZ751_014179 [Albula glossodonta]
MKARSSSPVHLHVDDTTPVHVHVQRSQSLPSSTETDQSDKRGSASDPGSQAYRKRKEKRPAHKSHSSERALYRSNITSKQAGQICSLIRSSDCDVGLDEAAPNVGLRGHRGESSNMSTERARSVSFEETLARSRMSAAELAQGSNEHDGADRVGQRNTQLVEQERERSSSEELVLGNRQLLLQTLQDAEKAANSAAIQLMSFKEVLDDDLVDSRLNTSDERRMSRQRNLLLEKLEIFKGINRSVRQQLKEFQDGEANHFETEKHMYILLKKLTQTETENLNLKRDLNEKVQRIEELTDLRKQETGKVEAALQHSKSVETTRAHLQGQLRHKESENSRLLVQLRGLERSMAEQKLEIESLKTQISSCSEKEKEEKEALKKATRAQKQRAEKFEAAVEKSYTHLRDKDAELACVRSEVELWKKRQEEAMDEKAPLEAQIAILKQQIADMTAQLQSERETVRTSNEDLLRKVEKLNSENGELCLENAALKASIAGLEEKMSCSEVQLQEQTTVSQSQKQLTEDHQTQIVDLQKEIEDLKGRLESLSRENEEIREGKDTAVRKVREELQSRLTELEAYPELLSAAEQRARECQESLAHTERTLSQKALALRELQLQAEKQTEQLRSSLDMKDTIKEANTDLQGKIDTLQRRVEEVTAENRELVQKLSGQEEALQYSSRQLEQRSAECLSLTRQLEAALADVKLQVSIVREKAGAREKVLQNKIQELDSERTRREKELRALKQSKESGEKQYEVRLKELQLRLDQSENHKQSIQNYVDFLKNSYATMFEDSLLPDMGVSPFLK